MVHETDYNPAREVVENNRYKAAYLGIQIVDLSDSRIDIAGMNSPSYLYAGLDRFLFKRDLDVRFLRKLLRSSRIPFAYEIVHDDEVDVAMQRSASCHRKFPYRACKRDRRVTEVTCKIRDTS